MSRSSLFVLSSLWEALPTVLIEAMACGAPVLSTDCPSGPNEILKGGELAPLVKVGDPDALARGMLAALDDPPDRTALRSRAQDFSLAASTAEYLCYIQRLC
jgi:glycosyltransferase involved in cell wall biosynthesis